MQQKKWIKNIGKSLERAKYNEGHKENNKMDINNYFNSAYLPSGIFDSDNYPREQRESAFRDESVNLFKFKWTPFEYYYL